MAQQIAKTFVISIWIHYCFTGFAQLAQNFLTVYSFYWQFGCYAFSLRFRPKILKLLNLLPSLIGLFLGFLFKQPIFTENKKRITIKKATIKSKQTGPKIFFLVVFWTPCTRFLFQKQHFYQQCWPEICNLEKKSRELNSETFVKRLLSSQIAF